MKLFLIASLAVSAVSAPVPANVAAKVNVVTTTPDLAALVREIGGDRVDVKSLAKPTEDPHFVDAKPSSIPSRLPLLSSATSLPMPRTNPVSRAAMAPCEFSRLNITPSRNTAAIGGEM